MRNILYVLVASQLCLLLFSCGGVKKAQQARLILQGNLDTLPNYIITQSAGKIQKGDILSIQISSDNPEASAPFNRSVPPPASSMVTTGVTKSVQETGSGYLVDLTGSIYLPVLGILKVEGLTRAQLVEVLSTKLVSNNYLKNPYIDIRFLNSKVTVIGEVTRPGIYSIPNEKMSILELLGSAGDLTIYGKRDKILVIRETDGKREFGKINLQDPLLFKSPFYYLQQNDVVIIDPMKSKPTADDQKITQRLTIASAVVSIVSVAAIVINLFNTK